MFYSISGNRPLFAFFRKIVQSMTRFFLYALLLSTFIFPVFFCYFFHNKTVMLSCHRFENDHLFSNKVFFCDAIEDMKRIVDYFMRLKLLVKLKPNSMLER